MEYIVFCVLLVVLSTSAMLPSQKLDQNHTTLNIENANNKKCASTPNPCSQICIDKPTGYECNCLKGYKIDPLKLNKCIDINECEQNPCGQLCENILGSYRCFCKPNYILGADRKSCRTGTTIPVKFLYSTFNGVHALNFSDDTLLAKTLELPAGLDFDWKSQCVFWAEPSYPNRPIKKYCDGMNSSEVILYSMGYPEGLAVDWIGRNIYWIDRDRHSLDVASIDGKNNRILLSGFFKYPQSLALHPLKGFLFWSIWYEDTKIYRAGMDGSNPQIILQRNSGGLNSLTVDFGTDDLYWVDLGEEKIEVSDINGENLRVISKKLPYIYTITLWGNYLYFFDIRSMNELDKYNKGDPKVVSLVPTSGNILKTYHPFMQPERPENPCEKANCSGLCLLRPEAPYYTCACSENFMLGEDKRSCISNCASEHFECGTRLKCIPFWWKCNNRDDCGDGSDEQKDCRKFICKSGEFQCDNGNCSHHSLLCNGYDNCGDKSDERHCEDYSCQRTQFKCNGNETVQALCIEINQRCNGYTDCPLGEDEAGCFSSAYKIEVFTCKNNERRVPLYKVCDGEDDCGDNSDESAEQCSS